MSSFDLPDPYGVAPRGLEPLSPEGLPFAAEALPALENLRKAAKAAGFELKVESAYRPFERQLSIWNRKAARELPLLDETGAPFARAFESEEELMRAILLWSALPGASRHHFGTEVDVSDAKATPPGYEVELTPAECEGMFKDFHAWLTARSECGELFGFERVFVPGRGKVRPEKWHLSHLPTARKLQATFKAGDLRALYERSELACKAAILDNFDELLEGYVYPYFI